MEKFAKLVVAVVLVGGMLLGSNIASADNKNGPLGFVITPDVNCGSPDSGYESFTVSVFNRGPKEAEVSVECNPVDPPELGENSVTLGAGTGGTVIDGVDLSAGNAICVVSLTDESPSKKANIVVTAQIFSCSREEAEAPAIRPSTAARAFSVTGTIDKKKSKKEREQNDD